MRNVRATVVDDRHLELSVRLQAHPGRTIRIEVPEEALADGSRKLPRPGRLRHFPGFGGWRHRRDIRDGAEWVRAQRRRRAERQRG